MPVAAALAVAGIGGALIGSSAAKSAANTQADAATQAAQYQAQAAQQAAQLQLGMFNTIRGDLAPYRGVGTSALPGYYALLGLPPPAAANDRPLTIPGLNGGSATAAGGASNLPAVGTPNWSQVLKDRPDVLNEYNKVIAQADPNSPWFTEHGLDKGPEGFAQWWYNNNRPPTDTYAAPTWTQEQVDALQQPSSGGATPAPAGPAAPALDSSGIESYLENLPGYKFVRDQGIKSTTNALSTKGLGGISGPMAKGISRFVTGLADTTYGEQLNRIANAVGVGQSAANQTGAFGQSAASGAGSNLVGGANATAAGITGAANASAAGTIGAANAVAGGLNGIANGYLTSRVLGMYGGGSGAPAGATSDLSGLY